MCAARSVVSAITLDVFNITSDKYIHSIPAPPSQDLPLSTQRSDFLLWSGLITQSFLHSSPATSLYHFYKSCIVSLVSQIPQILFLDLITPLLVVSRCISEKLSVLVSRLIASLVCHGFSRIYIHFPHLFLTFSFSLSLWSVIFIPFMKIDNSVPQCAEWVDRHI